MKKIFTIIALSLFMAGYSQDYYKVVLKAENYSINDTSYEGLETLFTLSDTEINVKPVGNMRLIKKAVSVKDTSVYFCEYQGQEVEVITVITKENFKVTVRGNDMKYVIESENDLAAVGKTVDHYLKNALADQ